MKTFQWSTYLLALTVALHSAGASYGQDKDLEEKGEIQIGRHSADLTAGQLYVIKVEGNGFTPQVNIHPGYLSYSHSGDFANRNKFSASYLPKQTQKHTFSVLPQIFGEPTTGAKLSYTFSVKQVVLSEKPVLKVGTKLEKNDPRYERNFRKAFHKVFPLAVKSGEFYVIEMIHKGGGLFRQVGDLDPYLILEDEATKVVASDDDSAGELNSRIVHQATKDGQFQVIATSLGDNQFGDFTLTIRSSEKK